MFSSQYAHVSCLPLVAAALALAQACGGSDDSPTTAGSPLAAQSWPVCTLLGPDANNPGVYGSDLGFTAPLPNTTQLAVLFGDTWAGNEDVCTYPVTSSDDMVGTLPATRPAELTPGAPAASGAAACTALQYPVNPSATPAHFIPMRLFPDAAPRDDARIIDMSMLRTPAAAFSDGSTLYGIFVRQEPTACADSAGCPPGMACSSDPSYAGQPVGACMPHAGLTEDAAPTLCLPAAGGCSPPALCGELETGVCLASAPFKVANGQPPSWYADDPRRAVAQQVYIASAFWPDTPNDFAVGHRFATNRFTNIAARTVANFDFETPDNNDYRPGNHSLLLWGRPAWLGQKGFQSLMFLAVQPLAGLRDATGVIHWAPKYFSGYGPDGSVVWSDHEEDAQPVYGATDYLQHPELDYVLQFSVTWLDSLSRWVMFYSGSAPAWLAVDKATLELPPLTYTQSSPGAMYLRTARHPWGQAIAASPASEAWTLPAPLLERTSVQQYLACADDPSKQLTCGVPSDANRPADLIHALAAMGGQLGPDAAANIGAMCLAGTVALDTMYSLADDSGGHLYGTNVIESWTQDVTDQVRDLGKGERAVELYWNVSTWNPYQVLLLKSQLRGKPAAPPTLAQ